MRWTALVPIKQGRDRKSRLAAVLTEEERLQLVGRMARHVLGVLAGCAGVSDIVVLSGAAHEYPGCRWAADGGRGLNGEITAFRDAFGPAPLLVIHADLPLLSGPDVEVLLAQAERHGAALATDRAMQGTNALALADGRDFDFRFGPESRRRHCAQDEAMPVIVRPGLNADLDTADDIAFLRRQGFGLPAFGKVDRGTG